MNYTISHSDIKSLNKCEFRWFWERFKNLMPINGYPEVMEVGTVGHSYMEAAFTVLHNGGTKEEAFESAGALITEHMDSPLKMKVFRNVIAFVEWFLAEEMRVVAIESKTHHNMHDGLDFGFTPDLVAEHTKGRMRGNFSLMDYKFTGQYWSDREINMFQQVPKYILYWNKEHPDIKVTYGGVVMLNTRANKPSDSLFMTKWVPLGNKKLERIEHENNVMLKRINMLKKYADLFGEDALKDILVHTADEKACKFCFFADDLCPRDFEGRDVTKIIERNYKPNKDYGYNGEIEEKSDDAPRG